MFEHRWFSFHALSARGAAAKRLVIPSNKKTPGYARRFPWSSGECHSHSPSSQSRMVHSDSSMMID